MPGGSADYEVGYGKPPRQSQWRKGQSGNPAGRPGKWPALRPERSFNPFLESFLKEMERTVSVREGSELVELPAFEALIRGMIIKGLKGDHRTGKFLVQMMEAAHRERIDDMANMLRSVEEYKADWPVRAAKAQRSGKPVPLPHPNHINLSPERGVIEITGPDDHQCAAAWEQLKETLHDLEQLLNDARIEAEKSPVCPETAARVRSLKRIMREAEKSVPPRWDWREKLEFSPSIGGGLDQKPRFVV